MNKKMGFFLILVLTVLAFTACTKGSESGSVDGISATGPKQYKVIYSRYSGDFDQEVSEALNDGWSLAGGVSYDGGYYQAVTK